MRDHQRQRILLAALDVIGEKGLEGATVKDLIRKAHVSRATFYEVFTDMEACLAELHDDVLSWLYEQVTLALAETESWSTGVQVALAKTVDLLTEDPRLAALCAVEAPVSRIQEVRTRHGQTLDELCVALRIGRRESPRGEELPEILEPALVYGAVYLVGRSIVYREGPDAATLAAELAELMLVPYRD